MLETIVETAAVVAVIYVILSTLRAIYLFFAEIDYTRKDPDYLNAQLAWDRGNIPERILYMGAVGLAHNLKNPAFYAAVLLLIANILI